MRLAKKIFKIYILTLFLVLICSCGFVEEEFGNYLRNNRIEKLLVSKSEEYKIKYRNIAWFDKDKDKDDFKLVYHLKQKVTYRLFSKNPCTLMKSEYIKLEGEGYAVFNNAIVKALEYNAQAIELGDEDKIKRTNINFYKCVDIENSPEVKRKSLRQ
jgi:hypothetical protein